MRTNPDPMLRLLGFVLMVLGAVLVAIGLVELGVL